MEYCALRKESVPFNMTHYGNVELTHARVFLRTPVHWNSKVEIRQRNEGRMQAEKGEYRKE